MFTQVEKSLAARLQAGVEAWTSALLGKSHELDLSMDTYSPTEPTHKPGGEPQASIKQISKLQHNYTNFNKKTQECLQLTNNIVNC